MRKLKLIWDFRGPDAENIAVHHAAHLAEFAKIEKLEDVLTGYSVLSNVHTIAYLVVSEDKMKPIRDALKPHRGQVFHEH